ncbi:hypothetical protein CKW46_20100 [Mycobacterium liflandii]|nr:hypothetical protein CKW46_20100 [Mycobacterium liflandii]
MSPVVADESAPDVISPGAVTGAGIAGCSTSIQVTDGSTGSCLAGMALCEASGVLTAQESRSSHFP